MLATCDVYQVPGAHRHGSGKTHNHLYSIGPNQTASAEKKETKKLNQRQAVDVYPVSTLPRRAFTLDYYRYR